MSLRPRSVGWFIAIIVLQWPITTHSHAQTALPAAPPPEIFASLPSGEYAGSALRNGKGFDVSLVIQQTKPGGHFSGTVVVHKAPAPCAASFPISGVIRAGGAVQIESKDGVAQGCERSFNLKLAGNDLTGTLIAAQGTFQIKLKKQ